MEDAPPPRALTIAGSDCSGCAGVQADLRTFSAFGVHAMSAITSVTAQDTRRLYSAHSLPPALVRRQIEVVFQDIGVDAAKTGVLPDPEIVEAVVSTLSRFPLEKLVVDPVMISSGGDPLVSPEALMPLVERLLPVALVVTPNLPEAEELSGVEIRDRVTLERALLRIWELGPRWVLLKGGHAGGAQSTDYLFDGRSIREFRAPRISSSATRGSGCTLSAALTAALARGMAVEEAVESAKSYVSEAIRRARPLGAGGGPLGHFPLKLD